ncbi:MAG: NAD(P)-dependent oxidoreductase, partial [Dehalococcoidia bacterium]|nr:NAD(P)-dependent oxidoreductase [Dehalococcoidia bacterium]
MTRIAFIGLGIMGRPMAGHLQAAGHELFVVRHVSPLPEELLEGGASECATAAEAASRSEVVITMVPDTPDVEEVLFGAGGVAEGLQPGTTVLDMSSISPIETKQFAERIAEKGCDYLDAPVSGGEVG